MTNQDDFHGIRGLIYLIVLIGGAITGYIKKRRRVKEIKTVVEQGGKLPDNKFYSNQPVEIELPKQTNFIKIILYSIAPVIVTLAILYNQLHNINFVYAIAITYLAIILPIILISFFGRKRPEQAKKIIEIVKGKENYIEVRETGIYCNICFLAACNFKQLIKANEAFVFIPWTDIKSMRVSSASVFGGNPIYTKRNTKTSGSYLFIKLKPAMPSAIKFGKSVFINLSVIDDYIGMLYLVKMKADKLLHYKV